MRCQSIGLDRSHHGKFTTKPNTHFEQQGCYNNTKSDHVTLFYHSVLTKSTPKKHARIFWFARQNCLCNFLSAFTFPSRARVINVKRRRPAPPITVSLSILGLLRFYRWSEQACLVFKWFLFCTSPSKHHIFSLLSFAKNFSISTRCN